jgi:hypothetical protein
MKAAMAGTTMNKTNIQIRPETGEMTCCFNLIKADLINIIMLFITT